MRAWAAACRTSGEGSADFKSMSGAHRLQETPVAERQRGLGPHLRAVVGQRRQQQLARAAVLELAHEVHQQPAHLGRGRRRTGAPSRAAAAAPRRRRASARRGLQPGIGQQLSRRSAAARIADLAQRRPRRAPHRRVLVAEAAEQRRAWPCRCRMRPSAVAAAQRTLQCSSSRARSSGGTACGSPIVAQALGGGAPQVAVGIGQHADQGPHRAHRADRAQRLDRGEAQLLASCRARNGMQPRHRLRVADLAERADAPRSASAVGILEQRQAGRRRLSGPAACRARAPPAAAPGCSRRGAPRAARPERRGPRSRPGP